MAPAPRRASAAPVAAPVAAALAAVIALMAAAPAPAADIRPVAPAAPAAPYTAATVAALTSGRTLPCEASADDGTVWPCTFRVTSYNAATGAIAGRIEWTNLASLHVFEGTLRAGSLKFTETRAIRAGEADLHDRYDMRLDATGASGTWFDPVNGETGPMRIRLTAVR